VGGLSGGNQQKAVLGRVLMARPSVSSWMSPRSGIDVGAKLEVYEDHQRADGGRQAWCWSQASCRSSWDERPHPDAARGRVAENSPAARPRRRFCWRRRWGRSRHDDEERAARLSPVIALALIWGVHAAFPRLPEPAQPVHVVIELSTTALQALGLLLVILPGHIDSLRGQRRGLDRRRGQRPGLPHGWPAPAACCWGFSSPWPSGRHGGHHRQAEDAGFIITSRLLVFKGLFWLVIRNATVPVHREVPATSTPC